MAHTTFENSIDLKSFMFFLIAFEKSDTTSGRSVCPSVANAQSELLTPCAAKSSMMHSHQYSNFFINSLFVSLELCTEAYAQSKLLTFCAGGESSSCVMTVLNTSESMGSPLDVVNPQCAPPQQMADNGRTLNVPKPFPSSVPSCAAMRSSRSLFVNV